MELKTSVEITGPTGGYNTGAVVRVAVTEVVAEVAADRLLADVTADDVDAMRAAGHAALKDAGKRLDAQLDVVESQAEGREVERKRKEREEAKEKAKEPDAF